MLYVYVTSFLSVRGNGSEDGKKKNEDFLLVMVFEPVSEGLKKDVDVWIHNVHMNNVLL